MAGGMASTFRQQPFTDATRWRGCRGGSSLQCTPRSSVQIRCKAHKDDEFLNQNGAWSKLAGASAAAFASAVLLTAPPFVAPPQLAPQAEALLTAGDPIKNARALLRNALPIDNKPIRVIQNELEGISEQLRIPGNKALGPVSRAVRKASSVLGNERQKIIADFAPDKKHLGTVRDQAAGLAAIDGLEASLRQFSEVLESKDKQDVPLRQQAALLYVGQIEEAMVKGFPFQVPSEYDDLPQLKGRATVDMKIKLKEARQDGVRDGTFRIVVDGYNAPVTAGDFVDLVERKFYDGMEIQRADGFVVQTGKPDGAEEGFVENGQVRRIPFEVMVKGDKAPVYGETLEDLGRYNDQPALPFNAYGTMALARAEFEPNSGSSQVFWLLKESELTPSGANLLDGRYAVFGYIVDGAELLADMQVGDKIVSAKVVDGADLLVRPKGAPSAAAAAPAEEA